MQADGEQGWTHTVRLGVRFKSDVFSQKDAEVIGDVLDLLWAALELFPTVQADLKEADALSNVFIDLLRSHPLPVAATCSARLRWSVHTQHASGGPCGKCRPRK